MASSYSKLEIANKIKAVMAAFFKANEKTWQKNRPPYLRDELAVLTLDLMAQAWDAGHAVGSDPDAWEVLNPYA